MKKNICRFFETKSPLDDVNKTFDSIKYENPFFMPMVDIIVVPSNDSLKVLYGQSFKEAVKCGDVVSLKEDIDGFSKGDVGTIIYDDNFNEDGYTKPTMLVEFSNYDTIPYSKELFSSVGEYTLEQLKDTNKDFNSIFVVLSDIKPDSNSAIEPDFLSELIKKTSNLVIIGKNEELKSLFNQSTKDNIDINELNGYMNYLGMKHGTGLWTIQDLPIPTISKNPNYYRDPDGYEVNQETGCPMPVWNR